MLSKGQIKLITSLQQKKYRDSTGLFFAEGPKVISELLSEGLKLHSYLATEKSSDDLNYVQITERELQKISALKNANRSLAVFHIPKKKSIKAEGLTVALDAIRDPGNLGTIIRLCDWFGITQLICSPDTADCYNPKVIQATMGSIARVAVHYVDLEKYLKNTNLPVYGGVMDGKSVYAETFPKNAVVVLGNEANGISKSIQKLLTHAITIPQFGASKDTESLNVATATAILLSEFKRTTET
ncbi:TrmH family RNA methyltransferase [Jejudonia soesokkakensis]|uniref:TrmH family RNA methyltransferase n=1 Tax=Jejudonia soesokkakensis TaxID=1323432 RepID=A0ABW2MS34_9FLAO